jgi:hypothetical protein
MHASVLTKAGPWAVLVTAGGLLIFGAVSAAPRPVPALQTPQAKPEAPDALVFNADRMLVSVRVAESFATDFEVTMGKVKEVLAKSDKPERRQQAAQWKLLKVGTAQEGVITYFFLLDRVVKGATYDPFKILSEGLPPEEVGALFQKVGPGLKGISAAPLDLVVNMGGVSGR